ncbi:hypothetical protein SAMN05216321_101389 [Cupriavidus sp. OV038]|jgi:hypothetical protein|uniref:hypothetical protein n=1 Tax=unclassified Cupriavidus TaxID=2640874 RepID=UPI0008F0C93B|nr:MULTISPECIES: hypothetical protein [unclassified Cupriavidus]SFB73235.1 hypothetical protein SAMN05216321_101389 [Cupriavidus sp. OV038]SFO61991.1 hypothetical protein SAMN05216322_101389 [Cupriavidus sp. OV096]
MKRWLFAAFGVAAALASGAAMARVNVDVAIGVPGVVVGGPAYYAPPPPVYYAPPAPVYYGPPPVVVRPAPVYYGPRYYPGPRYYYGPPGYRGDHYHGHGHGRGHGRWRD